MLTKAHERQIKRIINSVAGFSPEFISLDGWQSTGNTCGDEIEIKVVYTQTFLDYKSSIEVWFNPVDTRKCINRFPPHKSKTPCEAATSTERV